MTTGLVGSQTGNKEDYAKLQELCDRARSSWTTRTRWNCASFIEEKGIDLFIGGVKERPIAYKLGVGFCDHNHERKIALAGFEGMLNLQERFTPRS